MVGGSGWSSTPFAGVSEEGLSGQHTLSTTLFLLPCACLDGCYRDSKVAPGREWKEGPKLSCYIQQPKKRSICRDEA